MDRGRAPNGIGHLMMLLLVVGACGQFFFFFGGGGDRGAVGWEKPGEKL